MAYEIFRDKQKTISMNVFVHFFFFFFMCLFHKIHDGMANSMFLFCFHNPRHDSGGVLWYHIGCLYVHPSVLYVCQSVFSFADDNLSKYNLSKYQWILTKLGVCIDIMEI